MVLFLTNKLEILDTESTTETDSASTMYSYDVERIKQLATAIRKKGAKKSQRSSAKKTAPVKRRVNIKMTTSGIKEHQASKVCFSLPLHLR